MLTFSLFHINSVYGRTVKDHRRIKTLLYFACKKGEIIINRENVKNQILF